VAAFHKMCTSMVKVQYIYMWWIENAQTFIFHSKFLEVHDCGQIRNYKNAYCMQVVPKD
jgi:hypothetical protein